MHLLSTRYDWLRRLRSEAAEETGAAAEGAEGFLEQRIGRDVIDACEQEREEFGGGSPS